MKCAIDLAFGVIGNFPRMSAPKYLFYLISTVLKVTRSFVKF